MKDRFNFSPDDIVCKTEEEIRQSDITLEILENIALEMPLEKDETNKAIFDLLTKGMILNDNDTHLDWFIKALEEGGHYKTEIDKYLRLFDTTPNLVVKKFTHYADGSVKTDDLIKKLREKQKNAISLPYYDAESFDKNWIALARNYEKNLLRAWFIQNTEKYWVRELTSFKYNDIFGDFDENGITIACRDGKYCHWLIQKTEDSVRELTGPIYSSIKRREWEESYSGAKGLFGRHKQIRPVK